jgi:hypothetical protein
MEINGFSDYSISKDGIIYSNKSKKVLKCLKHNHGYCRIALINDDGKSYSKYVHRLVAETYLPNPENKPQVNHIDGNRNNHKLSNLEWVTQSENDLHSFRKLNRNGSFLGKFGSKHPTSIKVTNGKKVYESINRVIEDGFFPSAVVGCIKGNRKSHKGYEWRTL